MAGSHYSSRPAQSLVHGQPKVSRVRRRPPGQTDMQASAPGSDTVGMLGALDFFNGTLGLMLAVIAAFIVRAVRLTNASLARASRHVNLTNPDVATSVVDQIRGRELLCRRCGGQTLALLGTENGYQCESCDFVFKGLAHIPGSSRQDEPLRPL
jgi:hypothetical protein